MELGNLERALDYFQQALTLRQTIGDRRREATSLNSIGYVYVQQGRLQKALQQFRRAYSLSSSVQDPGEQAQAHYGMGLAYLAQRHYSQAAQSFTQARSLWKTVHDKYHEAATLYRLALTERFRGHLASARDHIEIALGITESLRAKAPTQDFRISFLASKQEYYGFYIDLLMQLHQREPRQGHDVAAFQASERARSRSL